jgi:hypothetical protein
MRLGCVTVWIAADAVVGMHPKVHILNAVPLAGILESTDANGRFSYKLGQARVIWGRDGGGIGSIALHPSGNVLAVAERRGEGPPVAPPSAAPGTSTTTAAATATAGTPDTAGGPHIFLYSLPDLSLVSAPLAGGTERAYADINWKYVHAPATVLHVFYHILLFSAHLQLGWHSTGVGWRISGLFTHSVGNTEGRDRD